MDSAFPLSSHCSLLFDSTFNKHNTLLTFKIKVLTDAAFVEQSPCKTSSFPRVSRASEQFSNEKFINPPLELHLEIVSHLSPDDLIKLIRILKAYDPSNSLCSAVHIIERPSDLERGSCKPFKVIFITNLFSSIFQYYQLVERCQKSLNFVLIGGDTQDSPLLKWLPMFLTDETIGHRTKVYVSGRTQKLRFVNLISCRLYTESLTRIEFVRCGGKGLGEFKPGGKIMRPTCVCVGLACW